MELEELISRAPARTAHNENDQWGLRQTSTLKVVGRHMLNVWRIMRSEQNLRVYTFENVVDHLLHERFAPLDNAVASFRTLTQPRFPYYSPATLTRWFRSTVPNQAIRLLRHFHERTRAVIRLLDVSEVVTKTACVALHDQGARVFC
jgi:DNA polymerase zeta